MKLTEQEKAIVDTTLYLRMIDTKEHFVPDLYIRLVVQNFGVDDEKAREIRNIVQDNRG